MLFYTKPKDSIKDLFDRESEIERLKNSLNERMILILGLRRTGKSSLVLSFLNSLNIDFVFISFPKPRPFRAGILKV
jgi:AAA+ ATPase superfamily predicted ATPase